MTPSNTENAFIADGETVRGARVMYSNGTTRTALGQVMDEIKEADTTGSLAAGEWPLGVLFAKADESLTDDTDSMDGQPVTLLQDGAEHLMVAGAAIDITTVANRFASWDNQGRGRVGVPGTDYILGEFKSSTTAAGQLIRIRIQRSKPTAS